MSSTNAVDGKILLVQPDAEQLANFRKTMPDVNLHEAPADWPVGAGQLLVETDVAAIIVFARRDEEEGALERCRAVRKDAAASEIPLLVCINMFQMMLANEVRRLPKAYFVISPIEKEALLSAIDKAKAVG